ncbi:MAG: transglutaminase family protein, partial [Pseudomonadota bacterium]
DALATGRGVCQDHAHVFIACARRLGFPCRYVSGYLMMNDRVDQEASHAWAEALVEGVGWVGFDVSNAICPDERYVRIATGCDYGEAAPFSGIAVPGGGEQSLIVSVQVQQ